MPEPGRVEVQGIVSRADNVPRVQMRVADEEGALLSSWTWELDEAREMAHAINEASFNAIYDAALVAWAKDVGMDDETMWTMLTIIRKFRADQWGLPDQPEDWRSPPAKDYGEQ